MFQTSIIILNLNKSNFVGTPADGVSLASQIRSTLTDAALYSNPHGRSIITHWSELPFLNRIIAIFETEADASLAYAYLCRAQRGPPGSAAFVLPETARISQQENLLLRLHLTSALTEDHMLSAVPADSPGHRGVCGLAEYHEPEPKPIDMYADLLSAGIDISKFNSEDQVEEVRGDPGHQDAPGIGRTRSLTKTLFKPSLLIDTTTRSGADSPASPIITLDQI